MKLILNTILEILSNLFARSQFEKDFQACFFQKDHIHAK